MAVASGVEQEAVLAKIRTGINMDIDSYRQSNWCERVFCGCFFGTNAAAKNVLKVAFDKFVDETTAANYVDFSSKLRDFVVENKAYFYRGDQQIAIFAPILRDVGLEHVVRGWSEERRALLASPSTLD